VVSVLLVALGLWVRLKLTETPAFAAALEEAPPPAVPLAELLRTYTRETIGGTFAVVACFAIFYLATAFALGYGTTTLGYPRATFLEAQLGAILFLAAGILAAGYLSDRLNPRIVLMTGCAGTVVAGFLLGPMMGSGSLFVIFLFMALALALMGFAYGPLGSWLPSLFPARVRYTGASVAFNVGGILGGALAPALAQAMAQHGGLPYVGLYLSAAAAISLSALIPLGSARARRIAAE
jgi:sugar phosphate permease